MMRSSAEFIGAEARPDTAVIGGKGTILLGSNENCGMILHVLDLQWGTSTLMGIYWQCSDHAYTQFVPGWWRLCALVTIHIPTLAILEEDLSEFSQHLLQKKITLLHQAQRRRTPDYFGRAQYKDIPEEFRLFTETQVNARGSIPFFTVKTKANAHWLQITKWELMRMINNTELGLNAINDELQAIRLSVLQHWYLLGLMTAMEGGVCAKIGASCCTVIWPLGTLSTLLS